MSHLKLLAAALAVLWCMPASAQVIQGPQVESFSGAYDEAAVARDALIAGDVTRALDLATPLAEAGNPVAQNIVGLVLTTDDAEEYAPQHGVSWFMRAGAQGYPKAWHNLGEVWKVGEAGIEPDLAMALSAYLAGADLGYEASIEEALDIVAYSDEEMHDNVLAANLANRGADLYPDNLVFRAAVIDSFYYGWDRPVDQEQSLRMFEEMAAETNDRYAQFSAGYQYYYAEGTDFDDLKAREYFELAAAQDHSGALAHLADLYMNGFGVDRDYERALGYAERAAETDHPLAITTLGIMYYHGRAVEVDFDLARSYLEQGRDAGYINGYAYLADMAYWGQGEVADPEKAFRLYSEALEIWPDDGYLNYSAGFLLLRGDGTEADIPRAITVLERGWNDGWTDAGAELVLAFGHPDYSGPHANAVRAYGYCLAFAQEIPDYTSDTLAYDETIFACEYLEATLSEADAAKAATLAPTL